MQIAFLNEFFYKEKDAFFIRLDYRTQQPETLYKNLTSELRRLQNGRWRREPVSGFRLCNLQQTAQAWRMISNIACLGSRFAAMTFEGLRTHITHQRPTLYVQFRKPRYTLEDSAYKHYYTEFYEKSHLRIMDAKIDMLERYYWRIDCPNVLYTLQMLFDIFGSRILNVCTDPLNGIEISQSPNIEADDYFFSDRHHLDCRIRFFQPFGNFFNMLKIK